MLQPLIFRAFSLFTFAYTRLVAPAHVNLRPAGCTCKSVEVELRSMLQCTTYNSTFGLYRSRTFAYA